MELRNFNYCYEDQQSVSSEDEDFQNFKDFVEDFFDPSNEMDQENIILQKQEEQKQNIQKLLKNKNLTKAIPGGMYGCALMLKNSEWKKLKKLSLGRLHALIKTALDKQIIDHYKTLIIKN